MVIQFSLGKNIVNQSEERINNVHLSKNLWLDVDNKRFGRKSLDMLYGGSTTASMCVCKYGGRNLLNYCQRASRAKTRGWRGSSIIEPYEDGIQAIQILSACKRCSVRII